MYMVTTLASIMVPLPYRSANSGVQINPVFQSKNIGQVLASE